MRRLSDRFAVEASTCKDLPDLGRLVSNAALELGFHYFALLDHAGLRTANASYVRIDNYPASWARELIDSGLVADDPVHAASKRANAGFSWLELGTLIRLEECHEEILSRSRHHGLGPGFTIPANVPGEPSASCSFAVKADRDLPLSGLRCAELVGAHALNAARRLRAVPQRPRLSRRELQCVKFVALGKSDWEISKILGLSIETVRQYVKRARFAYGVVTRTQLVVHALRDAWISFEDAIPPNG